MRFRTIRIIVLGVGLSAAALVAQRPDNPFPGGTNPDGSLRPTPPLTRLFTQDAYTEYAILEPGSEAFRIRFLPEETRVGATELVNATRGGSEGSDIEVYDPRTGKPMPFTYEIDPKDPETHAIHAKLPIPVPERRHRPRADLQDLQGLRAPTRCTATTSSGCAASAGTASACCCRRASRSSRRTSRRTCPPRPTGA